MTQILTLINRVTSLSVWNENNDQFNKLTLLVDLIMENSHKTIAYHHVEVHISRLCTQERFIQMDLQQIHLNQNHFCASIVSKVFQQL
jgi:hypothetical protein